MQIETEDKVLFWQADSIFSNWYPAKFEMHGITFRNSEAAFMYLKAELFNDTEAMGKLALAKNQNPAIAKRIGREIKGFNEEVWKQARENAMFIACSNKFHQNTDLLKVLLNTDKRMIVEASPVDSIWGIGLAPDNADALDETKWKGLNLLGKVLMQVRDLLKAPVIIKE
jgi:hypothetical protein